ncbi:MAG: O-antigen ligase family protein [Nitrospirae bacterium]|nr:O-antigen ligase family protein [Nitrospirota bacterium]
MPQKAVLYLLLVVVGTILALRNPFAGVITFILINYLRPETLSSGFLVGVKIPFVVSMLIVISSVINSRFNTKALRSPILQSLFLLVISLWVSYDSAVNIVEGYFWTMEFTKIILFCFFLAMLTDTEEKLMKFLYANMIGGGLLAVWAFQQHFLGNDRLELVGGGSTNSSNGIAMLFLLLLPLFLYMISSERKIVKLCSFIVSGVLIADIVFTHSRSAFVGLIVMMPYFFIRYYGFKKYWLAILVIPVFLFAAYTTDLEGESYMDRINSMFDKGMEVDESASSRLVFWDAAWELYKQNPVFGVGMQQFKFNMGRILNDDKIVMDAHNTFILILVEGGFFGIIFFSLAIIFFFWELYKIRKYIRGHDCYKKVCNMSAMLEASVIGFLISGLAHSGTLIEYYYWFLITPAIMKEIYLIKN